MSKFKAEKLAVLYGLVVVPVGSVAMASAMYDPRIGFASVVVGIFAGAVLSAAVGGIGALYLLGVRFLCRSDA